VYGIVLLGHVKELVSEKEKKPNLAYQGAIHDAESKIDHAGAAITSMFKKSGDLKLFRAFCTNIATAAAELAQEEVGIGYQVDIVSVSSFFALSPPFILSLFLSLSFSFSLFLSLYISPLILTKA
jgi:hypothetical protein